MKRTNFSFIVDRISQEMLGIYLKNKEKFDRLYKEPVFRIRREIFGNINQDSVFAGEEAVRLIENYQTKLEEEIKQRASKQSFYYWLLLSRRIAPKSPEHISRISTIELLRNTLSLAIIKYGKKFVDDVVIKDKQYFPRILTLDQVLAIYQIEYLSFEFYMTTAGIRRLYKRGKLFFHDINFYIKNDLETNKMINLYDQRIEECSSLVSDAGLFAAQNILSFNKGKKNILIPRLNVWDVEWPFFFSKEKYKLLKVEGFPKLKSNYVIYPLNLEDYYKKLKYFERFKLYNFSPEEFFSFLYALGLRQFLIIKKDIHHRYQFCQRAYSVIYKRSFIKDLAYFYKECQKEFFGKCLSIKRSTKEVKRLFKIMVYSRNDMNNISLVFRRPIKIFYKINNDEYILDFSFIPFLINDLFYQTTSGDGEFGENKGRIFEEDIKNYIKQNILGIRTWLFRKTIKFTDGTEKEVDFAFYKKNVLFMIECKARHMPLEYERGSWQKIRNRFLSDRDDLKKFDKACNRIAKEKKGLNFEVPSNIRFILPILCTAFPEYIIDIEDYYFLNSEIPRICTPEEIVKYIKETPLCEITKNKNIIKIE